MNVYEALGVAVGLTLANAAWATDEGGSASACVPASISNADGPVFAPSGVENRDQGSNTITCGFVRRSTSSPDNVTLDYYNPYSNSSLSCTVSMTSWTGSSLWSSTLTSPGTGNRNFYFDVPSSITGYGTIDCTLSGTMDILFPIVRGFRVE